jgi:hypothetical protein
MRRTRAGRREEAADKQSGAAAAARSTVPQRQAELVSEVSAWANTADADQLVAVMALSNAALPDEDSRKIRTDDVRMLRRLAGQARSLSTSLIEHAAGRRSVGERPARVSPEAGDTARWAERLAGALEAVLPLDGDKADLQTNAGANEYLDDQSRDFRDNDGTMWRVRIEQGGGTSGLVRDAPPVPVLIFRALDGDHTAELVSTGDTSRWELDSYSEIRLRELLAEARAHVNGPNAD